MDTATGSRRRFAHSIGEVHGMSQIVVVLAALGLLMATTAVTVQRSGLPRAGLVPSLVALSGVLLAGAAAVAAEAARSNTQGSAYVPQKTWRDYAHRTDFRTEFRFAGADVPRLIRVFGFDADEAAGRCKENGYTFTADDAISVLLFAMASGATLQQLNAKFGMKRSKASAVLRWSTRVLYERWHRRLLCTDFKRWAPHFPEWARAVLRRQGRDEGYPGIVGFVDGTFFATARPPSMLQRFFFSGHKWDHGCHFQGVQSPIGLLLDFCGPFEGRHHDKWMLKVSKLLGRFEEGVTWAA